MEKEKEVKVKYPEIRQVLQKLYKSAYNSGNSHNIDKGDGYDFSSAYVEIENIIEKLT